MEAMTDDQAEISNPEENISVTGMLVQWNPLNVITDNVIIRLMKDRPTLTTLTYCIIS